MISAVILTKNEEQMIANCINSCKQIASEIIVIDNGSGDKTVEIAMQKGARVEISNDQSFAKRRELGASVASGDWILYVDADERVTPELAKEIEENMHSASGHSGYVINRKDYYFGIERPLYSPMHRLFKKENLKGWHGELHETPKVDGSIGYLSNYFLHFTHTDIDSMFKNTMSWSSKESQLRFDAGHPPVVWWRLIRVFVTGFWGSFVTQKGYTCGTAGWVEALYQGCSMFFTYAKLWELQNKQIIQRNYEQLDKPYSNE